MSYPHWIITKDPDPVTHDYTPWDSRGCPIEEPLADIPGARRPPDFKYETEPQSERVSDASNGQQTTVSP